MGNKSSSDLAEGVQSVPPLGNASDQGTRSMALAGDLHPWAAAAFAFSQVFGAWIAADILFVVIAACANAFLKPLLCFRHVPHRVYGAVCFAVCWAVAMRAGFSCNLESPWFALFECARHPGRGLLAACMATFSVLVLSTMVRKDRMARTMLQLGINRQFLWAIFIIPTLGQTLLHASKTSALLMQGRYSQNVAPIRWIRLKVAMLTSSFVKTLTRHWYSREAEATRVRDSNEVPVFLDRDALCRGDFFLLAGVVLNLLIAFQI